MQFYYPRVGRLTFLFGVCDVVVNPGCIRGVCGYVSIVDLSCFTVAQ